MIQYSLVIDPGVVGDDLAEAVDGALAAAEAAGGRAFGYARTDTDDSGCDTHIWFGATDGEEVKAVEDPRMAASYLLFQGPEAEALVPFFAPLGPLSAEDIRDDLPAAISDHPDRLMLLALCDSRRFDSASAACIERYLVDANADVRLSAVNAAALVKWSVLKPALAAARNVETDLRVARTLDYALSLLG